MIDLDTLTHPRLAYTLRTLLPRNPIRPAQPAQQAGCGIPLRCFDSHSHNLKKFSGEPNKPPRRWSVRLRGGQSIFDRVANQRTAQVFRSGILLNDFLVLHCCANFVLSIPHVHHVSFRGCAGSGEPELSDRTLNFFQCRNHIRPFCFVVHCHCENRSETNRCHDLFSFVTCSLLNLCKR